MEDKIEQNTLRPENDMPQGHSVQKGLLLLGSFCIAYLTVLFLHEICHAGAAVLTGGHAGRIVVHPFNWSYSFSSSPAHPLFHTAAGAIGSSLIALILYIFLMRRPKPILLPLLLIGPVCLLENGGYWLVDIIAGTGADACRLIRLGIPITIVLLVGAVMQFIGILLVIHMMCLIGLTNDTFRNRLVTLATGILPYMLAVLVWNWLYCRAEFTMWLTYWASTPVLIIFIAAIGRFFRTKRAVSFAPAWPTVIGINLFALVLVTSLLTINFPPKTAFSSNAISSSTRPEGSPDILIPHPMALGTTYTTSLTNPFLIYNLPE